MTEKEISAVLVVVLAVVAAITAIGFIAGEEYIMPVYNQMPDEVF